MANVRSALPLFLALSTGASAQYAWQHEAPLVTSTMSDGLLGRMTAGEFTGDLREDVVLVAGTRPWVLASPGSFQSLVRLDENDPTDVNDVAVMPGSTQYGLDLILTVGTDGLLAWELDATTNEFESTVIEASAWIGALSVECVDLDGDFDLDVLGLAAGSSSVLVLRNTGSGFSSVATPTLASGIVAVTAVPWWTTVDANGVNWMELAIMRASSLQVMQMNGAQDTTFTTSGTSIAQQRFHAAAVPPQRLAWVTRNTSGSQDVFHVLYPGSSEGAVSLGVFGANGLAMGDVDLDGDDDAILVGNGSENFMLLYDTAADFAPLSPSTFSAASGYKVLVPLLATGTLVSTQKAKPALFDADNDGDLDVVVGAQGQQSVLVHRNPYTSEDAMKFGEVELAMTDDGFLEVRCDLPLVVSSDPNFGPTHVEGTIYEVDGDDLPVGAPFATFSAEIEGLDDEGGPRYVFDIGTALCGTAHPSDPGHVNCRYRAVLRIVERSGDENVRASVDTAIFRELDTIPTGTTGSTPLPNIGPTPNGTLPPRPVGSQPPPTGP